MAVRAASTRVIGVTRFRRSGAALLTVDLSGVRRVVVTVARGAAADEVGEPDEGDQRRDQPLVDRVLQAFGNRGGRLRRHGRQSELRERDAGEVAHLGAACLVLAVDRLHVDRDLRLVGRTIVAEPAARERVSAAGRGGEAPLDLLAEIGDLAEQRRAGRADVAAGWNLALLLQMIAELALGDLAERVVEIILRHAERAGVDAIAAADAGIRVVSDDTGDRILAHGGDRAYRHAGGIDAVQAMPLDDGEAVDLAVLLLRRAVAIDLDDVERAARQILRGVPCVLVPGAERRRHLGRHVVRRLACRHAGLAADAQRRVVEHADRLRQSLAWRTRNGGRLARRDGRRGG